jgi:ankyrin repeat protein
MLKREFHSNTTAEVALLDAANQGDVATVRQLLADGLDPNTPDPRDAPWNVTPLMYAAGHGHVEVVRELLKAKARLDLADKSFPGEGGGKTALHYAARNDHVDVAKLLIAAKADVNKVSRFHGTALCLAVEKQHASMASLLLEHGANPNAAGQYSGLNPLHLAAWEGHLDLVKLLVRCGADIDAQDRSGATPFMLAVSNRHAEVALFLLACGTDLRAVDRHGITSLMWTVIMSKSPELVSQVLRQKVEVNVLDNKGHSALDFAIRDELPQIQAILRKAGAKTGTELLPPKMAGKRKRPQTAVRRSGGAQCKFINSTRSRPTLATTPTCTQPSSSSCGVESRPNTG